MRLKKISQYFKYAPAALPLYSLGMVSASIVIFSLGALIHCDYDQLKKLQLKDVLKHLFPFCVLFILYVVSLFWTQDLERGFKYVIHTLSFIIFPIVIFVLKPYRSKREISIFIRVFIVSSFIFCLLTFLSVFLVSKLQSLALRDRIAETLIIGEHPIYFSLLLAISSVLLIFNSFKKKWITLLFAIVFAGGIILGATRGVFLALILSIIFSLFFLLKSKKQILFIITGILMTTGLIIVATPLKDRMEEFVNTKYFYPEGNEYNSFNMRMAIYKCSFLIIKEKPFFGYGAGDVQQELNECYTMFPTEAFTHLDYNTHNQYLHYLSAFGILGTIIVLWFFFYYLRVAFLHRDWAYLIFLIFLYLTFFTENILVRNTGIVVFAMFNCIFAYRSSHALDD